MPLPELLVGGAASRFDAGGNVTDPDLRESVTQLVAALRVWALRIDVRRMAA
jgi:hypothetical protein